MQETELRKQIRNTLVEHTAERYYALLQNSEYKEQIKNAMKESMRSVFINEDEDKLVKRIDNIFSPAKLQQACYNEAAQRWMTPDSFSEEFGDLESKLHGSSLKYFRKAKNVIYPLLEMNEKTISVLVQVANQHGVEKARAKESRDSAIRTIFHTKEDYISYGMKCLDSQKEYRTLIKKAIKEDRHLEYTVANILIQITDAQLKTEEALRPVLEKLIYQEANEIYGD